MAEEERFTVKTMRELVHEIARENDKLSKHLPETLRALLTGNTKQTNGEALRMLVNMAKGMDALEMNQEARGQFSFLLISAFRQTLAPLDEVLINDIIQAQGFHD